MTDDPTIHDPFSEADSAEMGRVAAAYPGQSPASRASGFVQGKGRGGRGGDEDLLRDLRWLPQSDTGNAWRFIARYGEDFIWCPDLGWFAWNGRHWEREHAKHPRLAMIAAQETARLIADEAAVLELADHLGETDAEFEKRQEKRRGWSTQSGNTARLAGLLEQAAPHLTVHVDDLDPDPMAIACQNGTVRLLPAAAGAVAADSEAIEPEEFDALHAFEPRHRREDRITRLAPVDYVAGAACPKFKGFLDDVQPDPAVQAYLARLCGYGLTGLATEEKLFVFEGKGRNGKGVFVDAVTEVLGPLVQPFQIETLLADDRRSGSAASPDVARLRGCRMAITGEPRRGAVLDDGRVKAWTGGDAVQARDLFMGPFEFRPTFSILVAWNNRPKLGSDDGIWARVQLLPWRAQILDRLPDGTRNPKWRPKDELLADFRAELPGLFNWMLRGYGDWATRRMAAPDIVRRTTASYRSEHDQVGSFVAECCDDTDKESATRSTALFNVYAAWCRQNDERPMSMHMLGRAFEERGFLKFKEGGVIWRRGIAVEADWLMHADAEAKPMSDSEALGDRWEREP